MRFKIVARIIATLIALSLTSAAETLTFRQAVELALKNSGQMQAAAADITRADAAYREVRNQYLPQVVTGSGLGYSIGFPLTLEGSAPSLFNVNSQQTVLNFSVRDFKRATEAEKTAATLQSRDTRSMVILNAALTYAQLDLATQKMNALLEQQKSAERAEFVTTQRAQEGLESQLELSRSKLAAARVRMRIAEGQTAIDVLRERLANLTGLAAASIETDTKSVPAPAQVNQQANLAESAVDASPLVKSVEEKARAAELKARGEKRGLWPSIDLASQYALLSKFNNYEEFYQRFERHNFTFGLAFRVPVLNFVQKAHADVAAADAVKARKEAENTRNQVAEDTLKLQRTVRQLAAAQEVAKLDYEVTNAEIDQVESRVNSGNGNLRDVELARVQAQDKFATYLDTTFELYRAQMQLMRLTGELESWALK
jgi:outer membrane protein TolC